MKMFILLMAAVLIAAAGALWSGIYNISALDPHWDTTHQVIAFARDRSIEAHSRDVKVPSLIDPKLAAKGVSGYHDMCRICHGAPGVQAEVLAQGLYPAPANLLAGHVQKKWQDNQLFWIIENGFKMTGMPAFGTTHDKEELIELAAFVKRLPAMTSEEYRAAAAAAEDHSHGGGHSHGK